MLALCMTFIDDNGDERKTFEELYYHYRNLMMYTALQILNNRSDAEDAVNTAFLRIAENFKKIDQKICPKTANQFVMIVRNIAIDIYRKNKRHSSAELTEDIEDNVFEDYETEALREAMRKLKDTDRDILIMTYIHGYSAKDASKMFGCSEDAVYMRLRRARKRLKELLEEE